MEETGSIEIFNYHLIREKTLTTELAKTEIAKQQNLVREDIHNHVVKVGATRNMNLIFAMEKLVKKVQSPANYAETNQAHSLLKNRVGGVPKDEARQFFRSHSARLLNQDKSRLTETEKRIVNTRRNNLRIAEKAYIAMQRRTLGLPVKAKEPGQGLSR